MRLVISVALYLAYIQSFCAYLLTGQVDLHPANPAGLLAHAPQLDHLLARPDGILLCALFALGCYGVAGWILSGMHETVHWLTASATEVSYNIPNQVSAGKMSAAVSPTAGTASAKSDVASATTQHPH